MMRNSGIRLLLSAVAAVACAAATGGASETPAPASAEKVLVQQILDATGVRGGLVVHVGCGDGTLTAALHAGEAYLVHGLDADAANVEKAREHIRSLGLYGPVSVERWTDTARLPYADNLVNLLVISDSGLQISEHKMPEAEVLRVLAPLGVAYVKGADGKWSKIAKPWPKDIDEWTHRLHDPGGNAVAADREVGPPRHLRWTAGPLWARSHGWTPSVSAMVSAGGRLFYILDETIPGVDGTVPSAWKLIARDAFSGVLLWKRDVPHWGPMDFSGTADNAGVGRFTMPPHVAKRLVAVGDTVYVTLGAEAPITALDAVSGKVLRTYAETAGADEILYLDGRLVAALNERRAEGQSPPQKQVCAVDAATGRVLWKKGPFDSYTATQGKDPYGRLELAAGDGRVFLLTEEAIQALDLDSGRQAWRIERPPLPAGAVTKIGFGAVFEYRLTVLVYHGGVVLVAQPEPNVPHTYHTMPGTLYAFDAKTGQPMWKHAYGAWGHCTPPDVFVVGDVVWVHENAPAEFAPAPIGGVRAKSPADVDYAIQGLDLRTGELRKRISTREIFDVEHHHRCYRNRITERFLMSCRRGVEFVDLDSGQNYCDHWVRGGCLFGYLPCNGLLYTAPHPCGCYIEAKISGFFALASDPQPAAVPAPAAPAGERLERGPAYGQPAAAPSAIGHPPSSDWPTYRHDGTRSGATAAVVGPALAPLWEADVGGRLSGLVVADGKVLLAQVDAHTVHALGAEDGRPAWRYTAGARVDSPPTVYKGLAIFGSADGRVYCLRAADGAEAWRLRAAPEERRIMAYEQLESPWAVPGSVLIHQDKCWFAAGRSSYLDGGIRVCAVDPATGRVIAEKTVYSPDPETGKMIKEGNNKIPGLLGDIAATDGAGVYIRQMEVSGAEAGRAAGRHLYTTAGYLDSSWFNRTFWKTGGFQTSGVMVMGPGAAYGVEIYPATGREMVFKPAAQGYRLICRSFASSAAGPGGAKGPAGKADGGKAKKGGKEPKDASATWEERVPVRITALVLAGDTLFAAGPPDVVDPKDPYGAWEGRKGGVLAAFSAADGRKLFECRLAAPPVWDGLAVVPGRLYVALMNGQVVCFKGEK
jgi:outer membrane protein assembly factor BamB